MISLDDAKTILDETLSGRTLPSENLPVRKALGRTLAADQFSLLDLPPFDKSAVDGYAILKGDVRSEYQVLETVAAGEISRHPLIPGTAIKIMTGAPVPQGTGCVVMVEDTEAAGDTVHVLKHSDQSNLCRKGEDIRVRDAILSSGKRLDAVAVAHLISCGITNVEVRSKIKIAILCTGDEIVDDPSLLTPGKIMNSNGPMLAALCESFYLEIVYQGMVADNLSETHRQIESALKGADVLLLSGGVSAGDFDCVSEALELAGLKIHFNQVSIKPGKPATFASSPTKIAFGLPGNPVSVHLTFHLFVVRAMSHLLGMPLMKNYTLPLAKEFKRKRAERAQFVPCALTPNGRLEALEFHGSAHLASLVGADGYFVVPLGVDFLPQGAETEFLPLFRTCR